MRSRLFAIVLSLLLVPALVLTGGTAANAETIRSTPEYQRLKAYVGDLEAKSNNPQTAAQIAKYRKTLNNHRAKANNKVRAIYQQSLSKAKAQRQNRRDKVRKMRTQRSNEVAAIKQQRTNRLNAIDADQRAAVARVNSDYQTKLSNLQDNRDTVKRKLAKAKQAAVKQRLREELTAIEDRIQSLSRDKQSEINLINSRYNNQRASAKESFASQIAKTKAQYLQMIKNAETALREAFAARREAAQTRRGNDFAAVRAEYERGVSAINRMPVNN